MDGRVRPRNPANAVKAPQTVKSAVAAGAPPAAAEPAAATAQAAPQPAAPASPTRDATPQEAPQRNSQPEIARSPRAGLPADGLEDVAAAPRMRKLERRER